MRIHVALPGLLLLLASGCDGAPVLVADAGPPPPPPAEDAGPFADAGSPFADAGSPFGPDAGSPPGPDAGSPPPIPGPGTVVVRGEACPRGTGRHAGASCTFLTVQCPGVEDRPVEVRVLPPIGEERGTVVVGSGSLGKGFYLEDPPRDGAEIPPTVELADTLREAGFRVIDRAWGERSADDAGWFQGDAGVRAVSCRYTALLSWIEETYVAPDTALCATGNSGGSAELAYALVHQGADAYLDLAVVTSGPVHRLDEGCYDDDVDPWRSECAAVLDRHDACATAACRLDGPDLLIDQAYGGEPLCSGVESPASRARLAQDNLIDASADMSVATPLRFLFGGNDCSGAAPLGLAAAEGLRDAGNDVTIEVLTDVGHSLQDFPAGATRIAELMIAECMPR